MRIFGLETYKKDGSREISPLNQFGGYLGTVDASEGVGDAEADIKEYENELAFWFSMIPVIPSGVDIEFLQFGMTFSFIIDYDVNEGLAKIRKLYPWEVRGHAGLT